MKQPGRLSTEQMTADIVYEAAREALDLEKVSRVSDEEKIALLLRSLVVSQAMLAHQMTRLADAVEAGLRALTALAPAAYCPAAHTLPGSEPFVPSLRPVAAPVPDLPNLTGWPETSQIPAPEASPKTTRARKKGIS